MTKNKIDARLEQCKAEGRKALITFITAVTAAMTAPKRQCWKWRKTEQT